MNKVTANIRRGLLIIFGLLIVLCMVIAGIFVAEEIRLNNLQESALEELEENEGEYDEHTIVLYDTSRSEAQSLANKFGAKLRITDDGKFATLTLSDDVSVYDVYSERANRSYLPQLSLDYYTKTSAEIDEETEERLPSRPDYAVSDGYYVRQTYLDYMNIGEAWNDTRGADVTVAVIDTGIDTDHPEFVGRISEYSYNVTEDKIVKDYTLDDGSYDWSLIEDEQGHGTAVSGVIAASMDGNGVVGIAPEVEILVIKAECNDNGVFYNTSDLVFGLYYAVEQDVDVVNMSFGTYDATNPFASAAKLAVESDIVCVAAAGNDGTTALSYPAADENVIGVGALAQDSWELASYSNYGENTNIVAPGTVYTSLNGGDYGVMTGTSFASPATAASIALYCAQNRYSEASEVKEILYASSYDLGDLGNDWYFGYGAIDVNALICEERGTVTFNMLTDELEDIEQVFIRNHTLQNLPEPERLYSVFDGWYFDIECTEELQWYEDVFTSDITLYANWVNEEDGVPYTYVTLDDGTVEIRSYTGHRRYITIPNEIEGKTVSSIGDFAFDGESNLRQINLPDGLENIGAYAFRGCNNLVSISIPSRVTQIGEYAFYNNARLSSVAFAGDSLTTIGDFAFAYCSNLERFELPSSTASLNGSVFYGDISLTAIGVRAGNTAFISDDGVLYNYTASTLVAYPAGLRKSFTVPSDLRMIGDYAFAYFQSAEVGLGNVQTIGGSAFAYAALERVRIPDTVTNIGGAAFANNFYLRELALGRGLIELSSNAFYNCFALESVYIPDNIMSIGARAFSGCNSLSEITFADGSMLTQIGMEAFAYSALEEIEFPSSLVMIGNGAFACNYALSSVTFGENSSLQVIGDKAFKDSSSLTQISLPENLMRVGDYAFQNSAVTLVELPASLIELGVGAFASCGELTQIAVADGNEYYKDIDGVVYNTDATEIVAYPAGKDVTTYTVENTAMAIGDAAFYGARKLNMVILPSGLDTVGAYGFYGCTSIQSYTLPETLVYIEDYAFSQNIVLTSLEIPDSVYQIGRYAFANDYSLCNITFTENSTLPRIGYAAFSYTGLASFRVPASVSTIAQEAFIGCSDLTSITFAANSSLTSISAYMFKGCDNLRMIIFENGSGLTSIQAHGFEGMSSLTTVDFGDAKITNIDNYAFRYNEKLVNITIPSTTEYIGRYAFYGCSALTRLDLPETMEYIGRYAFYGAENLNVYFAGDTLPLYLQENWDAGIAGYYVGVQDVITSGDWAYATLNNGGISIIKYNGKQTNVDLTTLDFGGDIVSIGGYAFYNAAVTSVVLPETLTSIQAYAFARSNISSVVIPASVEYIAKYAFFYTPLESVTFAPESNLKVMEQWAFAYTRSLNEIELPWSLQTMGSSAFYYSGITSVTFAQGSVISEIPESAFASSALMSVVLPDSVTLVNDNAFRDCAALQSVTFGAGEDLQLMSNAFYNTGLTSLHIPANLTYIGEYALVGLQGLEEFAVDENNPEYAAVNGVLYDKEISKIIAVPAGKTGSLTLPATLETIGYGAFENSSLETISFDKNSNILSIGYRAFYGANALTQITIPASVVSIDYYAFAMCENLKTVIFAEGSRLTGVYEGAFYGCTNLKDIILPDSVVEISDFAFYGCISLTQLPVSEDNQLVGIYSYAFAYTGIFELNLPETLVELGQYAFRGAKLTKVVIPDTNREQLIIGLGAFADCNNLTEITLPFIGASFEDDEITWFGYIFGAGGYDANNTYVPESLKTVTITEGITFVGTGAFYGLLNIEKINVPHSVTMVYNYSFATTASYEFTNTISLGSSYLGANYFAVDGNYIYESTDSSNNYVSGIGGDLVLAEGVTSIAAWAFNLSNLTSIYIPKSVQSISSYAFQYCSLLERVIFEEDSRLTKIDTGVFSYCNSLKSIEIPDNVLSMEHRAFAGCSQLSDVKLPSNLVYIDTSVFSNCISLMDIEFPNNLTRIGSRAFDGCTNLKNILLPTKLTSIGMHAFGNCDNLISVSFTEESQLSSIEEYAFNGCNNLTSIEIPNSVTYMGDRAFSACYSLATVKFESDSQLLKINDGVFSSCSSLKSITIPNGVTSIGSSAFSGCESLMDIELPESLSSIDAWAFSECTTLMSILLPENLEDIGMAAFSDCFSLYQIINYSNLQLEFGSSDYGGIAHYAKVIIDKEGNATYKDDVSGFTYVDTVEGFRFIIEDNKYTLVYYFGEESTVKLPENVNGKGYSVYHLQGIKNVILPNNITKIDENAFYGCRSLESIEIPNSVTSIESYAFYGCSSLKVIKIPDRVTKIGNNAFTGCNALTSVEIPDNIERIESYVFSYCSALESIIIPDNVTSIGAGAFDNCISLKSIAIPDQVTIIEANAFRGCSELNDVVLPSNLKIISTSAFSGCTSLERIVIPDNVSTIEMRAFYNCSSLISVEISSSVTSIGSEVFSMCNNLAEISISSDNLDYFAEEGVIYNRERTEIVFVSDSISKMVIPSTVTSIGGVFSNKINLQTVIFEAESCLTSIGDNAFYGCSNLSNIELPSGIKSIGVDAFYGCASLKSINIPTGVTSIQFRAFCESGLTSIEVPDSVTSIDGTVFYNCSSLTSVTFGENSQLTSIGENAFWNCSSLTSITIPDSVTSIGDYAFYNCGGLESVTFGENSQLTSIGDYAFYNCGGLESVTIGNGVTSIDDYAFYNCGGLESVTFGENSQLTSIGSWAFRNCSNLTSITIPDSVASIGGSAFEGCYHLYQVTNLSDLLITIGGADNGYVAYYAKVLIDKEGNKTYKEEASGFTYIDTIEGFRFMRENDDYTLIAYFGDEDTVTLPENINGSTYTIYRMHGVKNVILPNTMTSIGVEAFYDCSSLISVVVPDSVTSIEQNAFGNCSNLISIILPDSITSISIGAFDNTAYYNDASNWENGCLYIGNHLIKVQEDTEYFVAKANLGAIATRAFDGCYQLISVTIGGNHVSSFYLTNLETLIITETPTWHNVSGYFGSSTPLTLKTIVLKDGVQIRNSNMFYGITGVTVYVEASEFDVMWDEDYPNWHNGNTVYYGDEWINATFYDVDGNILESGYYLTSQVVRQPYYEIASDEQFDYVMVGWDLNGDGIVDSVPATSNQNIMAYAVIEQELRNYTVNFLDVDGSVLYTYVKPYGSEILAPEPTKEGYTFLGWEEYTDGMTVIEDVSFVAQWQHDCEGHVYGEPEVIAPTCTEQGYTKHICTICGEWYATDYVDANGHSYGEQLTVNATCTNDGYIYRKCSSCGEEEIIEIIPAHGHSYGEWVIIKDATCTENGLRYHVCGECGDRVEETIVAAGHNYIGTVTQEASCEEYGEITYSCEHCGDTITEQLDKTEHRYVKKYVPKSWLRWLVETLLNIFFGYEGNDGYYFECADCRHIQTSAEAMLNSSVQSTCNHVLGEEQHALAATCEGQGIYGRYCTVCGELIEARTVDALGHEYSTTIVAPTCSEYGYTLHTCSRCGDYYITDVVEKVAHTPGEAVRENEVAATCESAGSYETVIYCTECGAEISREKTEVSALGHTASEWIVDVEADCTHNGSRHKVCTVCNKLLETDTIEATGHDYGEIQTIEATCETAGYTYHECKNCGCDEKLSDIPALGHTASEWIVDVAADCTHDGSRHKECTVCGETLETEVTTAIGHAYGEVQTVEATCETTGYTYQVCATCGHEKVLFTTGALGHTASEWVVNVAVDCTHDGCRYKVCTACGKLLETETIEATGHAYGEFQTVEATCETAGYTYHVCESCGHDEKLSDIPALGHTASEWIVDVAADCTHNGSRHKECTVCGEILETEVLEATGHDYGEVQTVEATCETAGYTYYVCEVCGNQEVLSETAAFGHDYDSNVIAPTCCTAGYTVHTCSKCGYSYTDAHILANGHIAGDWIVDKNPTTTDEGERHIECIVCGHELLRETIPVISETGMGTGTVVVIAVASSVGVGGCSGLLVWFILRKRRLL